MSSNNNAVAGPPKPPRSEATVRRVDWPVACSLLLGVLFLERLSFSFIKAGLAPHLHDSLGMDRDVAETCVQLVVQVTFFAPIVGAMLADAKYGKYGALRSLFPVYFLGQVLLSCSPVLPAPGFIHPYFDFFALFLLSYGCGCCRAVLAAYGADQLWPLNGPQLGLFFALFYAQEHLASVFCSLLLPFLKTAVPILPLPKPSLGVLLLATTLLCFAMAQLLGLNRFFRQNMPQGQQSVFSRARHTIGHAIHNKWRHPVVAAKRQQSKPEAQPTKKDLLDHFLDDHNCARDKECDFGRRQMCGQAKFLAELKAALRTGMMLAPLPLFWALHSQLIATSAVQAQNVDLTLPFLGPVLSADQLNLLPSLLFLLLLPLFVMLFNSPGLARLCSLNTYLRRMSAGILLAAMACSLAASVQMLLDMSASPPVHPPPDSALFKVFNIFPAGCSVSMSRVADPKGAEFVQVSAGDGGSRPLPLLPSEAAAGFSDFQFRFNGSACAGHRKSRVRIWIQRGKLNVAVVGPQGIGWAAVEVRRGAASQLLGFLVLLPCNSLDSPLPRECANSSGDPLAFSLMPFASGISLCSSATQQQSTDASNSSIAASDNSNNNSISPPSMVATPPESNCPLSWAADEAVASQLFVFPPRGDNLGMARSSLYKPKAVQPGSYKLSLIPTIGEADSSSPSSSSNDSSAATQSADSAAVAATAAADSDQTSNSSGGGLKQEIRIADASGFSLVVLSLDGSPLAGQNDSSSARPTPTITILALAGHASLNIIWLLPQNLLLAASEVLLCVSGLEFCYSQAPNAVRATMIGCWYLTIYVGMSLTPLLSKFQPFSNPSYSLLLASSSLFTVGIVFASLAHFFFKYRDNFTGAFANGGDSTHAPQSGLAEKLEGTLRASMARLPTKKVIRL